MRKDIYENFSIKGDYLVLRTRESYHKTASGKNWRRKPYEVFTEVFTTENYEWFIQAIPVFKSRAYWNYTVAGYIPVRVTTVNPEGIEKFIDVFQFVNLYALRKTAGWRENEILENAKTFELEYINGEYFVHLYTGMEGVTACGTFELNTKRWVG